MKSRKINKDRIVLVIGLLSLTNIVLAQNCFNLYVDDDSKELLSKFEISNEKDEMSIKLLTDPIKLCVDTGLTLNFLNSQCSFQISLLASELDGSDCTLKVREQKRAFGLVRSKYIEYHIHCGAIVVNAMTMLEYK